MKYLKTVRSFLIIMAMLLVVSSCDDVMPITIGRLDSEQDEQQTDKPDQSGRDDREPEENTEENTAVTEAEAAPQTEETEPPAEPEPVYQPITCHVAVRGLHGMISEKDVVSAPEKEPFTIIKAICGALDAEENLSYSLNVDNTGTPTGLASVRDADGISYTVGTGYTAENDEYLGVWEYKVDGAAVEDTKALQNIPTDGQKIELSYSVYYLSTEGGTESYEAMDWTVSENGRVVLLFPEPEEIPLTCHIEVQGLSGKKAIAEADVTVNAVAENLTVLSAAQRALDTVTGVSYKLDVDGNGSPKGFESIVNVNGDVYEVGPGCTDAAGYFGQWDYYVDDKIVTEGLAETSLADKQNVKLVYQVYQDSAAGTPSPVNWYFTDTGRVGIRKPQNNVETQAAEKIPQDNTETPLTELNVSGSEVKVSGGKSRSAAVEVSLENMNISSFESKEGVDWYSVKTSDRYSGYSFNLSNDSISTILKLFVYDGNEKELGKVERKKGETGPVDLMLEKNTRYYIKVERLSWDQDKTGNYRFSVNERICDAGAKKEAAFNILIDQKYDREFNLGYSDDWYVFKATENYAGYDIELSNKSVGTKMILYVYDEYDKELARVETKKGETASAGLILENKKTYYLRITRLEWDQDKLGNYSFNISERLLDAGAVHDEAFGILLDKTYEKALDVKNTPDWFSFRSTENYSGYRFTLTNGSVNTKIHISVYDEYDRELGKVEVGKGNNGAIDLMLEEDRMYYLCVDRLEWDRDELGNYKFSVTEIFCDSGNSQEEASEIRSGRLYEKQLELTCADDWYWFTAESGTCRLDFTNSSVDTKVYFTLFDEYNMNLKSCAVGKGKTDSMTIDVESGKKYYVYVSRDEWSRNHMGDYSFKVTN